MATPAPSAAVDAMLSTPVPAADMLIVMPLVLSFLFGSVLLMVRKRVEWHGWISVPGFALVFAADVALLFKVATGGPFTMMMGSWRAPFGIAFTLDLMGALFLATAGFVALAAAIFAVVSVDRQEKRYGFFPFLFLMMGGVSGAFVTGDIFNLYVWFEVLLIGSFGLLVLGSRHAQLDGTTKYAFLNLVGTTLFLIAVAYLYGVFGTLNMADIARQAADRTENGAVATIAMLFLVAFAMKAAAFPLNAWLPASYHTPRFVVSALFAGLLTKVGVYALIRVLVMLFPAQHAGMAGIVAWIAGLTMMTGALGALAQTDIRRLLNYVVIAGIGTVFAGLAIPQAVGAAPGALASGLSGAIFYALHSIVVMTALYLAAGVIARRTGASTLETVGGLWRESPLLSALCLVFLLAVSGLPPFSGFWPKVMLVRAAFAAELPWLAAAILVSGLILTIASARVFAFAFWRPLPQAGGTDTEKSGDFNASVPEHPAPLLPLVALAAFVLAAGVWPEWLSRLTTAAADGVVNPTAYIQSVFGGGA
ncbi:Na+/H+ antiporter subunit D [Consotaella salsifontis]|uniref:Multicomponent Na+:H+ antiporter subunit D n=1 Tax=Consotaella salsifontis TaxID=1365950 RepID=A0A1T4NPF5_9HYPH|nr:Na+/H+ antiporter subunit D [Consotaella salsifontis]SJZ80985.1 multicomponent Na+:H+ antiporter subunit D [Consotaella salsifontis]